MAVNLHVNGSIRTVAAEADTPLLYVLRNDLGLKGAKFGCGLAQCGGQRHRLHAASSGLPASGARYLSPARPLARLSRYHSRLLQTACACHSGSGSPCCGWPCNEVVTVIALCSKSQHRMQRDMWTRSLHNTTAWLPHGMAAITEMSRLSLARRPNVSWPFLPRPTLKNI